ncbi:unnamed protein product [Pleuronectes platessa]|uniref:Uncharacterized protein n=1 Tax=Pleuronectes platessa TaxID=8262 RepID=A0A9N7UQE2_PLEPL|nr:unnamed protein product [Pleuronectes platessa]
MEILTPLWTTTTRLVGGLTSPSGLWWAWKSASLPTSGNLINWPTGKRWSRWSVFAPPTPFSGFSRYTVPPKARISTRSPSSRC